ncbi:MAG: bifunctional folylpolyglutamate synthase/dihydrofolate synthase [Flavobacteriaceae bacterium]|nr:bifunctional folylpolyglutamate synthase/dihydrofolate synthase [Flavobacteriaceae bacterium]
MNYIETTHWMFSQLPMYQNKGKAAYKSDLSNTIKLASHLKHPQTRFKSIHVAGTNGKGSTSHMIASVLQEAGYKVGLYTSPHLKDYRERIKINGKCISKQFVIQFVKRNKAFFEANSLSFFEMTVGLAFEYFAKKEVDIAVIEVGLGGRLDSTNIINPEISVITNIGLDHTQFLGDTLKEIAKEKAGVIKPNTPVVIGQTQDETVPVFDRIAEKNRASIYYADQFIRDTLESDLKGSYQHHNIKTAMQTINLIRDYGYHITNNHLSEGLSKVVPNTGLLGRWQIIQENPRIVCDTAHNAEGLSYTLQQIQQEPYARLHMVIGVVNDKNLENLIKLFPKYATYYFCKPDVFRGLDANVLRGEFEAQNYSGNAYNSVSEAFIEAKNNAACEDFIYIGGSTFVVAEII